MNYTRLSIHLLLLFNKPQTNSFARLLSILINPSYHLNIFLQYNNHDTFTEITNALITQNHLGYTDNYREQFVII